MGEIIHQSLYFHQGNHIYVYGCSRSKCLEQSFFGHTLSTNSVHVSNTPEEFEQHIYYYIVFWLTKNGTLKMFLIYDRDSEHEMILCCEKVFFTS